MIFVVQDTIHDSDIGLAVKYKKEDWYIVRVAVNLRIIEFQYIFGFRPKWARKRAFNFFFLVGTNTSHLMIYCI